MLSERQTKIVEFILNSISGAYANEIAEIASITTRTLRNEIREINNAFQGDEIIKSDNIRGYFIPDDKLDSVRSLLFERKSNYEITDDSRALTIIGYLLEDSQNRFELADKLFISEQTLYRNFSSLKTTLQTKYEVELSQKGDEYSFDLPEFDIRRFVYRLIQKSQPVSDRQMISFLELIMPISFNYDSYMLIKKKTKLVFGTETTPLIKTNLLLLSSVIYFTQNRDIEGAILQEIKNSTSDLEQDISKKIQSNFDLNIKSSDLLSEFISTFNIFDIDIDELTHVIVSEFVDDVLEKYNFDIKTTQQLYDNLLLHCEFMLRRVKEGYELENPLKQHIKNTYPLSLEMSMLIVPIIYKYKQVYISQDEISYIALYIEHFVQNFNKKIHVLIEKNERKAVFSNTLLWLESNFSSYIKIISADPGRDLNEIIEEENIELIISFDESSLHPTIPTYRIYNMPNKRDLEHMNTLIYQIKIKHRFKSVLQNCFSEDAVIVFDRQVTFEEVISELSEKMVSLHWLDSSEKYIEEVLEREIIYPTAMGNGVMLPHPLFHYANKTCIAVGVLKKKIESNDNSINLILLLGTEAKENDRIPILFSLVDEIVNDSKLSKVIEKITSGQDFIDYLVSK